MSIQLSVLTGKRHLGKLISLSAHFSVTLAVLFPVNIVAAHTKDKPQVSPLILQLR